MSQPLQEPSGGTVAIWTHSSLHGLLPMGPPTCFSHTNMPAWVLESQTSPETLDEGLDITRPGYPTDPAPSPLTPGSKTGLSRGRRLGRVWSRGPRRRTDGSCGFMGAVESPVPGAPRSNQTPIFKMRKLNSQRESDFFQITDTGRI